MSTVLIVYFQTVALAPCFCFPFDRENGVLSNATRQSARFAPTLPGQGRPPDAADHLPSPAMPVPPNGCFGITFPHLCEPMPERDRRIIFSLDDKNCRVYFVAILDFSCRY
jgi:hypothetical protein